MNKTLVAYFSCSGNTKAVAEKLSEIVKGDLFEIKPVTNYTNEDLNWNNEQSRSTIEMKDKCFRPAILNKVDNINNYDTIYLGYPIWWYKAPSIINSFIESYDLTNKKIITFCTSGSSGIDSTTNHLKEMYPNLNIIKGKRFNVNDRIEDLKTIII